ncbi:major facilitator transporter [Pokkaliibacter plantistimulans]|uniref:Major facilitator transporter n=2 Tax=Pseudomonadota TaxID=1224 RepID=A0ABX5LU15_9GAMM|nr:MFS transporter [Pokkaliibacter plantistimulans]PPC78944.1 MFS transporter [Pokkaliibacter plantistimulans]PXF29639.1 major facilitator transporter [Pokkaliibacter plantistimulans]
MIQAGSRAYWRATLALCLGSFMIFSNLYVTQPLLPMLAADFQVSPLSASYSFTVSTLTLGLSLLVYGPLSDVLGRRGIMLITMAGVIVTTLALSQTNSYEMLLGLRAVQGFFLGGLPAIAVAYMGDEFDKEALMTAVGLYIGANTLGGIGGRLIGGFAGESLGWANTFLVIAGVSLVVWLSFAFLLPRSSNFQARPFHLRTMLGNMLDHLRNPILLTAYLIGGFNFFVFINQYSYITFVLGDEPYSLSPRFLGMLFLTYLTGTLGSALAGRAARRFPQPLCMAFGIVVLMLGSLCTLLPSLWTIILGFFINSFGFFFAHSTNSSWVSRNAQHAKASASSLYLVFYYTGASTGGIYLHPFWEWRGWTGVIIGSLVVLVGTLSAALYLHRKTRVAGEVTNAVAC